MKGERGLIDLLNLAFGGSLKQKTDHFGLF
jgi:hypothetical protein